MEKTPDQIRRETVPVKHSGFLCLLLGAVVGAAVWFGGWGLLHQEQARHFRFYISCSHFGHKQKAAKSGDRLTCALLRYGNTNHMFDGEILRHGWYPKGEANPARWVYSHAAVSAVYQDSAFIVVKWPLRLTLLTALAGLIWGLVSDSRYRSRLIAGIPFEGAVIATVAQYTKQVKGDGMKYAVKPWKDR
jgi:hypothetical protein